MVDHHPKDDPRDDHYSAEEIAGRLDNLMDITRAQYDSVMYLLLNKNYEEAMDLLSELEYESNHHEDQ